MSGVDVRRSGERDVSRTDRLLSRASFSFGARYDPGNTAHGPLVAHNEDVLRPGGGYPEHPHRDVEIVTWVLAGALVHEGSTGPATRVEAGGVQRLSAGRGVVHSERNADPGRDLHLVQAWLLPDTPGAEPGYAAARPDLGSGELVAVVSGRPRDGALPLGRRDAVLWAARLHPGAQVRLPEAPWLHLFVAAGTVDLEGTGPLAAGDAVRSTASGGQAVRATGAADLLVWELA